MIRMILCILYILWYILMTIFFAIYGETAGRRDPEKRARVAHRYICWGFRQLGACAGVKKHVIGLENVPQDQPVLYVSNHRSYFDVISLYPLTKPVTGLVAKKEMEKWPLLRNLMNYIHCVFLDREDVRQGLRCILTCIDNVKKGGSVIIFPEGTRTPGNELLEFKQGSFKIAERSGCPIIPVAISNTENCFEKHMPYVTSEHVLLEFGKPIYMKDLTPDERRHIGPYVQNIIAGMLEKNQPLVESYYKK